MVSFAVRREKRTKFLANYGLYLTVSSYIKPGALHRFSVSLERYDNLVAFVFSLGSVLDEVIEYGYLISRGKKGLNEFPFSHVINSIKALTVPLHTKFEERLVPALLTAISIDLLHFLIRGELGGDQHYIFSSISGESVKEFYDLLKVHDREAKSLLNKRGYSETNVMNASLLEIASSLAQEGRRDYEYLLSSFNLSDCVSEVNKSFSEGETPNNSVVRGFIALLMNDPKLDSSVKESLRSAVKLGGMRTREGSRALLELDRSMSARGLDTNDALVLLLRCVNRALLR